MTIASLRGIMYSFDLGTPSMWSTSRCGWRKVSWPFIGMSVSSFARSRERRHAHPDEGPADLSPATAGSRPHARRAQVEAVHDAAQRRDRHRYEPGAQQLVTRA